VTGTLASSTGVLRIGGNSIWSEWFAGRIVDRPLTFVRRLSIVVAQTAAGGDVMAVQVPVQLSNGTHSLDAARPASAGNPR